MQLVSATGTALQGIIGRVGDINAIVSTIAASAEQQSIGLQQVNTAIGEMDGVTQQNAAMVEQATAATRSLASEAEELAEEVARFRLAGAAAPIRKSSEAEARREGASPSRAPRSSGTVTALRTTAQEDWSNF